jgi:aspartate kinase
MDDRPEKIERLALAASEFFDVQIEKNCTLLTIRHYNDQIIQQLTESRIQLLSQKTKETIQILLKTQ